jgi:hypothetical protein
MVVGEAGVAVGDGAASVSDLPQVRSPEPRWLLHITVMATAIRRMGMVHITDMAMATRPTDMATATQPMDMTTATQPTDMATAPTVMDIRRAPVRRSPSCEAGAFAVDPMLWPTV